MMEKFRTFIDYNNEESATPNWEAFNFNENDATGQAMFAYYMKKIQGLEGKKAVESLLSDSIVSGTYVEFGAGHFKENNNTYYLEKYKGWKGISLDISEKFVKSFNENRNNPCIEADALNFSWETYFIENNFPKQIDYLSIDLDHVPLRDANLLGLINFPISRYRPAAISIEHNLCVDYSLEDIRTAQRKILSALDYMLVIPGQGDDCWVDRKLYSQNDVCGLNSLRNNF